MLFLVKLTLDGFNTINSLHIRILAKIITEQILELYVLNGLRIFTCLVNINLFFLLFIKIFIVKMH